MKRFTCKSSVVVVLFLLAICALCIPAGATANQHKQTSLNGGLGDFNLVADAVKTGDWWTYSYALTYVSGGPVVETFSVGNPCFAPFVTPENTDHFWNPLTDPVQAALDWTHGTMNVGDTVTFSYKSHNAPLEDPFTVFCYAVDHSEYAFGETIGMSESVPEPGSMAVLAMGLIGAVPMIRRRRK